MDTDRESPPLDYATPAPPTGSGLAAGVWITLAGLALIVLGGCFCIGVMFSQNFGNINGNGSSTVTAPQIGFVLLLYFLAFGCFAAAALLLFLGIKKLLSIGRR